jgi:putative membrane protein
MVAWILVVHVFGITFWVGGLLVTGMALVRHTQETTSDGQNALARLERIFLRGLADVGALLALTAGITLVANNPAYYLHARWLHIKLLFVLMLIVLHGAIAVGSKMLAKGRIALQRSQALLLVVAVILVFLLILISTLPGEVFLT